MSSGDVRVCYLLHSQHPSHPTKCYIGYTTDPTRRIRQHNGEVNGGAKKTSRHRPWHMVLCVSGFPNEVAALQFEWAWQNPSKSRLCKADHAAMRIKPGLPGRIQELYLLLSVLPFRNFELQINFHDDALLKQYPVPATVNATARVMDPSQQESLIRFRAEAPRILQSAALNCTVCGKTDGYSYIRCASCSLVFHAACAARRSEDANLLPSQFSCACGYSVAWASAVRTKWLRQDANISISATAPQRRSPVVPKPRSPEKLMFEALNDSLNLNTANDSILGPDIELNDNDTLSITDLDDV
ncbi:MAG: hypothetical protein MHM6MM_005494 [Cercozoa sp. M6MM]